MPISLSSPMSTSSPVVNQVLERKRRIFESNDKFKWSMINFLAAVILFLEAENHLLLRSLSPWRLFFSRIEITFSLIFIVNAALDAFAYFFPFGVSQTISGKTVTNDLLPVSPQQRKLLGIPEADPNFCSPKPDPKPSSSDHPFGFPAPLDGSFVVSSTPARSPANQLDFSDLSMTTMVSGGQSVLDVSSWLYFKSPGSQEQAATPKSAAEPKVTPSPDGVITNESALKDFIRSVAVKEEPKKDLNTSSSNAVNQSSIYWHHSIGTPSSQPSTPISAQDYSPMLKKLSYQLSAPMPNVASNAGNDESGSGVAQGSGESSMFGGGKKRIAHTSTEHVCDRIGINPLDLASWMQNLRHWISQTILSRLIKEIESINKTLAQHGISDVIGQVGVEKLIKNGNLLPEISNSINRIVPFIEFTVHQDYLIHRINELSRGGAISDYKWNSGSSNFKGQAWSDKFPSDCEIIMNCFAAYLDNCLPPNYSSNDGKPFTNVYYVKAAEKSATKATENVTPAPTVLRERVVIMQTVTKPPYFFLQLLDDKLDVSPGRNNLFHTLILFLHHVKTKESGHLGRTNFGASGINILWVIE